VWWATRFGLALRTAGGRGGGGAHAGSANEMGLPVAPARTGPTLATPVVGSRVKHVADGLS
jgi:hypothetical protein